MRSLSVLRMLGIGLAFAALLAGGGLPVSSQGQEEETIPSRIVTLSYPDSKVACLEARFGPDGRLAGHTVKTATVGRGPSGLAISPDGAYTYVVSWDAQSLTVLENERCTGIRALTLGGNLYTGQFRPDGGVFYALDAQNRRIVVLDTTDPVNPQVFGFIPLPGARAPRGIAFSPDGQTAYVSDTETDVVWTLDAVAHRLRETLRTGGQCSAYVKVSNLGEWVYVADRCLSRVYAYEVATGMFTPIQLSGNSGAWFIAFTPTDRVAFVSQTDPRRQISSGRISVIDVARKMEIDTIDLRHAGATAQGEYAPAGLDVGSFILPDGGMVLAVFPFISNQPILSVSFTLTTSSTGTLATSSAAMSTTSQPGGISVSISAVSTVNVGLIRPIMGMDDGWTEFDFGKHGQKVIFTNRTDPPVAVNVEVKVDAEQGKVQVIVQGPRGELIYDVSNQGEGVDDSSLVTVKSGGTIVIQDGGDPKKAKGKAKTRVAP